MDSSLTTRKSGDESPHSKDAATLGRLGPRTVAVCGLVGAAALAAGAALGWMRGDRLDYFLHSYLLSYCYWLSLSLGGLFFVALQHVSRAGWSVTVRRLAEFLAANMFCLAVLFLPILAAVWLREGALYPWAAADAGDDAELARKAAYLNPLWFSIRAAFYLLTWWLLGRFFLRRSLAQDRTSDVAPTLSAERLSPVALILYAFTLTFAAFDWLMSLTPHWSSTIFGAYYFSGAAVAGLAVMILLAMLLQRAGRLERSITVEHYHDLGKLLLAFVIFWGYMAFSQYLLIWYANIPEETVWYRPRHAGPWGYVSLVLLFGNLLVPFFGLLSRTAKRRKGLLAFWAVWLLAMHWIDLYWLVMPSCDPQGLTFGPIDACCLVGIGGMYLAALALVAGQRPLAPLGDPRLGESLAFENT
jgi:hypothetical protein